MDAITRVEGVRVYMTTKRIIDNIIADEEALESKLDSMRDTLNKEHLCNLYNEASNHLYRLFKSNMNRIDRGVI